MKTLVLLTLLTGALSWAGADFEGLPTGKESVPSSDEALEKEVLYLVNEVRRKRGLKPLLPQADLSRAARYHAKDMATDRYFEHDSMDRTARGTLKKLANFGVRLSRFADLGGSWAENIAQGHPDAESVMRAWMRSSGHRRNILSSRYRYLGGGYGDGYWVQDFGD